jgi:cob(I)alamin adenosyltransferase
MPPTYDGAIVALCDTEIAMTINLTRIYTKLGDNGETDLGDRSRVRKDDPRIEAYGTVDELGAQIAVAITQPEMPARTVAWLRAIQNDLFDVGADLCVPQDERERLRVQASQVEWLEARCDEVNGTLEPLRSFVLAGGNAAGAALHVCRTVCRRAERCVVALGDAASPETLRYLNRLSDLLFILAREATRGAEMLWEPGRSRE